MPGGDLWGVKAVMGIPESLDKATRVNLTDWSTFLFLRNRSGAACSLLSWSSGGSFCCLELLFSSIARQKLGSTSDKYGCCCGLYHLTDAERTVLVYQHSRSTPCLFSRVRHPCFYVLDLRFVGCVIRHSVPRACWSDTPVAPPLHGF